MPNEQLWGGRFRESLAGIALRFSRSIDVDRHLFREDIAGSLAHVAMLADKEIIPRRDARAIARALKEIRSEIERGEFTFDNGAEDVHLSIEKRLIEKIGPAGGRLHTARSRNDQVALDERLYLREAITNICELTRGLQRSLLTQAEKHTATLMPGYTHLQRAQPILLAHHLLAYVAMLERDYERMSDCSRRLNRSPLGAAALAGTSFPIDRMAVAKELGFDGVVENSIDAVSDRDYIIEFTAAASIAMMHLSRLAEEIVLWSTAEFGFIEISDAYATGSSIMPQKKNPDMAELVRGKTGRVYGDLIALLTMMKGLPLAYNRDMQEDKEPLFDAVRTLADSLSVMTGMMQEARFNAERTAHEASGGYSTATEMADYLVRKGLPFRDAHHIVGAVVGHCVATECGLEDIDIETLRSFSPSFDPDIYDYLIPERSVRQKRSRGSTSPSEVARQIRIWKKRIVAAS